MKYVFRRYRVTGESKSQEQELEMHSRDDCAIFLSLIFTFSEHRVNSKVFDYVYTDLEDLHVRVAQELERRSTRNDPNYEVLDALENVILNLLPVEGGSFLFTVHSVYD